MWSNRPLPHSCMGKESNQGEQQKKVILPRVRCKSIPWIDEPSNHPWKGLLKINCLRSFQLMLNILIDTARNTKDMQTYKLI